MHNEQGWYKNDEEQSIDGTIERTKEENEKIIEDISADIFALVEKIDDKFKAGITIVQGLEKFEGSLDQLKKDLAQKLHDLIGQVEQAAVLLPSLHSKLLDLKSFSEEFIKTVEDIGVKISYAQWENSMMGLHNMLTQLRDTHPPSSTLDQFSNN